MRKEQFMAFLHELVFDPVLNAPHASRRLRLGVDQTIRRLAPLNVDKAEHFFWSAIVGTDKSVAFAAEMQREGFARFEDVIDEYRRRFPDRARKPGRWP